MTLTTSNTYDLRMMAILTLACFGRRNGASMNRLTRGALEGMGRIRMCGINLNFFRRAMREILEDFHLHNRFLGRGQIC